MQVGIWATKPKSREVLRSIIEKAGAQVAWQKDREANPFVSPIRCDVILVAPKSPIDLVRSMQIFKKGRFHYPPFVMVAEKKFFPPLLGHLVSVGIAGNISPEDTGRLWACLASVSGNDCYFDFPIDRDTVRDYLSHPNLPGFAASIEQLEVWELLARGMNVEQIAAKLNLTGRAIESRKHLLMRQLKIHSQPVLIERAADYSFSKLQSNASA